MIYDVLPVNTYIGNGSYTDFDFNFYIENETQLEVKLINPDETRDKLTLNVDYTINEVKNKNGSFITYPIEGSSHHVLQSDEKIVIELSLQFIQETQYNNSSLLNLESLEYSFDYVTRLIQILQRRIDLCLKVEEGSDVIPKAFLDQIVASSNVCKDAMSVLNDYMPKIQNYYNNIITNYDFNEFSDEIRTIEENIKNVESSIVAANSTINTLAKKDFSNASKPYMKTTYRSGVFWYRIWSDGFIEQSGTTANINSNYSTITFLKPFSKANTYYFDYLMTAGGHDQSYLHNAVRTVSSVTIGDFTMKNVPVMWYACGY